MIPFWTAGLRSPLRIAHGGERAYRPISRTGGFSALYVAAVCALAAAAPSIAMPSDVVAGSDTPGGLVRDTRIMTVTSLNDDGPGSLREALSQAGPRVIVFAVAGVIGLKSDLRIANPDVTIAGQTAAEPGITITGGALRIRTHDVVVQHIAVRPGASESSKLNENRDGISIDGRGANASYSVRLENVSASWSADEAVTAWYATTRSVTIRNSIVAEALRKAGHPKGEHSMGLMVGTRTTGIEITGNLLANNVHRNPVMGAGSSAFVANNYIVNPGLNAIHFYSNDGSKTVSRAPTLATILENVVVAGPNTSKGMVAIRIPSDMAMLSPDARLFIEGNVLKGRDGNAVVSNTSGLRLLQTPEVKAPAWKLLSANEVEAYVLRYAGSRPAKRNTVDARLLDDIARGRERIVDSADDVGGLPQSSEVQAQLDIPADPHSSTKLGMSRLAVWLCLQHLMVGGPATPECTLSASVLQSAL